MKKPTPRLRAWAVRNPLYKTWFLLLAGGTAQAAARRFDRAYGIKPGDSGHCDRPCHARSFLTDSTVTAIWFPKVGRKPSHRDLAALAHECTHTAMHVLHRVGHTPTADADEPLAYLVEWTFHECVSRLWP